MKRTFGERRMTKPEGMLRAIHWPSMATMDQGTNEGMINRILKSEGAGTRDLPRSFKFQFAALGGHEGAVTVGSVDQVTFDDEGNVEGWGWLVDTDDGRKAAVLIGTGAQRHNSVDLAEVEVEIDFHWDDLDAPIDVIFNQWKISSTTGVADPAFANATIELNDEMTAAIYESDEPLEITAPFQVHFNVKPIDELLADGAIRFPWADFHIPEADKPHKITVDEDGRVSGHLAEWGVCHEGYLDRCVVAPNPTDLSAFHHPGPLTERGQVATGPLFLLKGHPDKPIGRGDVYAAYGGIENCWADVRATPGVYGIWVSGRVRPGLSEEMIHAARCSHSSGHWQGNRLLAGVSVNVPGFRPRNFAHIDENGEVLEMVAGYVGCSEEPDPAPRTGADIEKKVLESMLRNAIEGLANTTVTLTSEETITTETVEIEATVEYTDDHDFETEAAALELELDLIEER